MPKALVVRQIEGERGKVYYPLAIKTIPTLLPESDDLVVKMQACALNRRDLFIRQHLYPGISFGTTLLADGCGVVSQGPAFWKGKRVILNPGYGWAEDMDGPETEGGYRILGGTKRNPLGTAQDIICVSSEEVEEAPVHLSDAEAASLPLAGLTAWRALMVKSSNAEKGRNILITGIGGGVALNILQFAVTKGCRVFVTSGSEEKIKKAKEMGAIGGVNYKVPGWENELLKMLEPKRPLFDAIIDSAGGNIMTKAVKILKYGGVVSIYGMTLAPNMDWPMKAVMNNIELKGAAVGSRKEFKDMVDFVKENKIVPVISRVVKGLSNLKDIDGLFEDLKNGNQFGKLVIQISSDVSTSRL